jgi:leucyl/phenylalanyl-tRNA--protein transferase
VIAWLTHDTPFPPLERALDEPNGLLAAGGDLGTRRLVAAYRRGIFPWYSEGQPILWWSPDPRMVLYVSEFRVSRSLERRIRRHEFTLRADTAFRQVIEACARAPRAGQFGTWITPAMVDAYCTLHALGHAHSVEAWQDGTLVGGLYGLALGRVFFGESMFAECTDASKVALAGLVSLLRAHQVPLVDCQQETAHLASLGARPIPRRTFAAELVQLIHSISPPYAWPQGALAEPA